MSDCPRINAWRGCKFEPRYDLGRCDLSGFSSVTNPSSANLERFRQKTYVRDVCVRCGRTIERPQPRGEP